MTAENTTVPRLLTVDEFQAKYKDIHTLSPDERYGYELLYHELVSGLQGLTPAVTQQQLDDADRRAGAAERQLEHVQDTLNTFTGVRSRMKREWGVHENVSFDIVWAEAIALKHAHEQSDPLHIKPRDQKLLELGYSRGWSDHKQDQPHGMQTPEMLSMIATANKVKP